MPDKIRIIGVPMDLGASRRGVDMGPSALRVAGLQARLKQLGRQVEDIGKVQVPQPEEQPYGEKRARYLDEISQACKGLADAVKKTLEEDMIPLVAGGDHGLWAAGADGFGRYQADGGTAQRGAGGNSRSGRQGAATRKRFRRAY